MLDFSRELRKFLAAPEYSREDITSPECSREDMASP
jgi:hypothetical protein